MPDRPIEGCPRAAGPSYGCPVSPEPTAVDAAQRGSGGRGRWLVQGRSSWGAVRWVVGTVAAVAMVGFLGLSFAALPANDPEISGVSEAWRIVGSLAAVGCGIAMIWRTSRPLRVLSVTAAAALALPIDPFGTVLALTWALAVLPLRRAIGAGALAGLAVGVTLWRDWNAGSYALLTTTDRATGEILQLPGPGYVALGIGLLGIAVLVGILRRYRSRATAVEAVAAEQADTARRLQGELDRQSERELIAREMHDTVAHHLSLVSLHAAALEVTSTDPAVPESARAVRDSAHRALEEMRLLISSLRESDDSGYRGVEPSLDALPQMLSDARAAGADIAADLRIEHGSAAPRAVTRAVYRIVQESITNAIKHGRGSSVSILVHASPGPGVDIAVSSWLVETPPAATGAGAGLLGMRERAAVLGGTLSAGPEGPVWVVRVHLPWSATTRPLEA